MKTKLAIAAAVMTTERKKIGARMTTVPSGPSKQLTVREQEVAACVCKGKSNKEIARALNIREGTVKIHLHNIYGKLSVPNRTALAMIYSFRSGCADFPLPVLHGRASLAEVQMTPSVTDGDSSRAASGISSERSSHAY